MKKLTEAHPLHKKYLALEEFMNSQNIVIHITRMGSVVLTDVDTSLEVVIVDSDDNTPIDVIPSAFEFKLIIEE